MHHAELALGMTQRLMPQPIEEFGTIRGIEDGLYGVVRRAFARTAVFDHQQIKVVVAEYGNRGRPQIAHIAQGFQRLGAAIDEVANQPQTIAGRAKRADFKKTLKRIETPLNIAYRVSGHLLYRHALGEVARLVDIGAFDQGRMVGKQLQGHHVQDG